MPETLDTSHEGDEQRERVAETRPFRSGRSERGGRVSTRVDRRRRTVLRAIGVTAALPAIAGVAAAKPVRTVVDFDPPDLPENLAVDDEGNVFMSMAATRELRKLPAGTTRKTGLGIDDTELIATVGSSGFLLGVEAAGDGTLYTVTTDLDPTATESAVWSVSPGGSTTQLASLPVDAFPNGVVIDADRNRLLVSDSFRGEVWAVALGGSSAITWLDDSLLDPSGFVGANGLAVSEDVLYVANLDAGRIVRIPIESDGSAGAATVFVEDASLVGADGITFHDRSTLYVAVNAQNAIRRVNGAGKVKTVVSGGPLDFPADVAFDTRGRGRLFVANFAFGSTSPNPALLWTHP